LQEEVTALKLSLQQNITSKIVEINEYHNKYEDLRLKLHVEELQHQNCRNQYLEQLNKTDSLQESLQKAELELVSLKAQIQYNQNHSVEQISAVQNTEKNLKMFEEEIMNMQVMMLKEQEKQLEIDRERDEEKVRINQRMNEIMDENEKLRSEIKECNIIISTLNVQLEREREKIWRLESDSGNVVSEMQQTRNLNQKLVLRCRDLERMLVAEQMSKEEKEDEIKKLKKKLLDLY
jgi:hypothetical protein